MKFLRSLRLGLLAMLVLGLAPAASNAGEFYYLLIFGSEDDPKHLRNAHTWAVFVRAVGEGTDQAGYQVTAHTLSWYPASKVVRLWSPCPEPGVNLTLEQTLETVLGLNENVRLWGPFQIQAPLYNRSVAVYNEVASGRAQYRAISALRDLYITDCIHVVAAVDPVFGRGHYPLIRIGQPASRYMARQVMMRSLEKGVDQAANDNSWLIPALGLIRYPITIVPPSAITAEPCGLCKQEE